jgi:hypothetical protein
MQKELEEANLLSTNLDSSTCIIDVNALEFGTRYSFQFKHKALDNILARILTFEFSLSSLQTSIPSENMVFELICCCARNFHKNSKLLVT